MSSENLTIRNRQITREITEAEKQLAFLPDGKLICT